MNSCTQCCVVNKRHLLFYPVIDGIIVKGEQGKWDYTKDDKTTKTYVVNGISGVLSHVTNHYLWC